MDDILWKLRQIEISANANSELSQGWAGESSGYLASEHHKVEILARRNRELLVEIAALRESIESATGIFA